MTVLRWTITFDLHISGNERKKFFVNTYKKLCIPYAHQSSCSQRICVSYWLGLDLQCKPHHTKLMISSAARQKRQYPWPTRSDAVADGAIGTAWKDTTIETSYTLLRRPWDRWHYFDFEHMLELNVNGLASVCFLRAHGLPRVPVGVGILGLLSIWCSWLFLLSWL